MSATGQEPVVEPMNRELFDWLLAKAGGIVVVRREREFETFTDGTILDTRGNPTLTVTRVNGGWVTPEGLRFAMRDVLTDYSWGNLEKRVPR